jgi:protein involved in polysaccharide export with SLBB domain
LRVRDTGEAVLPVLGPVELGGYSLEKATEILAALYKPYYISQPIVRLQFEEDGSGMSSPWGSVTVLGRVRKPGRVNLPPTKDMTVSGAIQGADGFDTSANLTTVRITRIGPDGSKTKLTVNLNRIGEDGDAGRDVRLQAGDVIFVPERVF